LRGFYPYLWKMTRSLLYTCVVIIFIPLLLSGQTRYHTKWKPPALFPVLLSDSTQEKDCQQKDIIDLLRKKGKPPKPLKSTSLLLLPTIYANPANGLVIGVGGNLVWFLGPRESTRISLIGFSAAVTTKEQIISFIKSSIYTKDNKYFLFGDLRFYDYRSPTYGLGTNSPIDSTEVHGGWIWQGADTKDSEGAYPMLYDFMKFHETVYREITKNVYAGIGYHLDYYWNIIDDKLNLDILPKQITPHYAYCDLYGFNPSEYVLSGLSVNFMYDSRDNLINTYKGSFVNISYRINPTWLGSDQKSSAIWTEFRTFVGLSQKRPNHLIAFWLFGNFVVLGEQPYLTLMAVGEDQKARSGRGYVAGRYRGEDMIYGEIEYRFPISRCSKILGGVVFANATTTSNRTTNVHLFEYIRPSFGVGIRAMFNKHTRLNINLDLGFGYKSQGFYFSGTETF